jgi:hypothetical protein
MDISGTTERRNYYSMLETENLASGWKDRWNYGINMSNGYSGYKQLL